MLYWSEDWAEEGHDNLSDLFDQCDEPGVHPVECAMWLPSIWVAVRPDPQDTDTIKITEHATEAEARAALAREGADE